MNAWTFYPSLHNRNRAALGSPDGRELRRGQTVEILLGGFRILGFLEYSANGVVSCHLSGYLRGLPNNAPRCRLLPADRFRRISWRGIMSKIISLVPRWHISLKLRRIGARCRADGIAHQL